MFLIVHLAEKREMKWREMAPLVLWKCKPRLKRYIVEEVDKMPEILRGKSEKK